MPPTNGYKHIPILLIDVADFTSKYDGTAQKRALLKHLQRLLINAARFFMPHGDPWQKWTRHGTGDGYYFLFDALSPQVVAHYALQIRDHLEVFNRDNLGDMALRLRMVLAIGDVEWVDDQLLSDEFAVAERLISDDSFKNYARTLDVPAALAITTLFHQELRYDLDKKVEFGALPAMEWSEMQVTDKHGKAHHGYVLGSGCALLTVPRAGSTRQPYPAHIYKIITIFFGIVIFAFSFSLSLFLLKTIQPSENMFIFFIVIPIFLPIRPIRFHLSEFQVADRE